MNGKASTGIRAALRRRFPLYKHILALAVTILFLLLSVWSGRHTEGYFFEWLSRQSLWWGWGLSVLLIYLGQWIAGTLTAVGHVAGVPIARAVGDWKYARDQARITPDMTPAQLEALGPKHAFIWWEIIAGCLLAGLIAGLILYLARRARGKTE